jgi:hypothetical protein
MRQGEEALVGVAADVWAAAPQRAAQAIDRLMALRLVSGGAIVRWAFACAGTAQLGDEAATGLAWEAFHNAINKMIARTQARAPWVAALCGSPRASLHGLCMPACMSARTCTLLAGQGCAKEDPADTPDRLMLPPCCLF